jgi:hypothetical protein
VTFVQTFGGTNIYSAEPSYRAIALTANVTLSWPIEMSTDENVVAKIMDVTPNAVSRVITMPPANQVSVGQTALFFNVGSYTFTVNDNAGNAIVSVAPGLAWQVYLTDNTTAAGSWRTVQFGAGSSSATAGALTGYGIVAIANTLNQSAPVSNVAVNYTIGLPDRAGVINWTGGAGTFTLPGASTCGNNWFVLVRNSGNGAITLATPGGETINGDPTMAYNPGDSAIVTCDGADFYTVGFGQAPEYLFDYVSIDLTGQTSPYILSGANLNRISYNFTGTLLANMVIQVPNTIQQYWVSNQTSGAYTLGLSTSGGTAADVTQGARAILYCDGTNVYYAQTGGLALPITISQGGTGATNITTARTNLGATSVGVAVFTAANATAGRVAISAAASGANSDITSLSGLTTPLTVPQGGTGVATITGVIKGNGTSALTAATAGTDFVAPGTATTFTATQTFTGSTSVPAEIVRNIVEPVTVSATAATGTIALYPSTQSVLYYTTNASGNFTVNLTWSSGTTMNTALSTGQAVTVAFMVTNGATAYYNNVIQVDGTTSGVTTRWQGGIAPVGGNASSIDIYTYTVIKTGSATFTVLASQTKFA